MHSLTKMKKQGKSYSRKAVLNSSCLIALSSIDKLSLIESLFSELILPESVYQEIFINGERKPGTDEIKQLLDKGFFKIKRAMNVQALGILRDELGNGEAEAIILAMENNLPVILDDKTARRKAKFIGLEVIGTLRVLRILYDNGSISKNELITSIEKLKEKDFFISDKVIGEIIKHLE